MTRRAFCGSAMAAAATVGWARPSARAAESQGGVKFFKNFSPGHIGVRADQRQALGYAVQYGFAGIAPSEGEFENKSAAEIGEWLGVMRDKGVRYGAAGLSVEFRKDDDKFRSDIAQYPKRAALLKQLGVTRVATWLLPGSNELTYLENFKQHESRLREAAKILYDHGIRLGLEFVGPRTSRSRFRYPFACAQRDMMELVAAIGTGNVGLLLDSWHWYTSHGTVEELTQLSNKDIVHVHVNDAPAGVAVDQQVDNRRGLPVTTGVIDMKGFVNSLVRIGYDGPVEVEPFDQELRKLEPDTAVRNTAESLNRVWDLIAA
ncbi:MAG TPA: sugar phosphate isomerase/epimerase family protein [Sedimentisphaerales bacterium]|nr:sugar phosphate isomerase/epimerase family protein [Sedimentisphaerales bacterium]HNU30189.1 sugar phosphate isomerase/epimerase family protein [Sedimentisphaerales bacterium]